VPDNLGLSWQIVPLVLMEAINDPDNRLREAARWMAMMPMVQIDIDQIEAARRV